MRLKPSFSCRRCRFWLEGEWSRIRGLHEGEELKRHRAAIVAQMDAGECWDCQAKRLRAAEDFIRLADQIRELSQRGAPVSDSLRNAARLADANLTETGLGGYLTPLPPPRPAGKS